MKKFRIFLSLKKEEEWINSIQEEGYKLVSVNSAVPMYTFEKLSTKEMFIPYVRLDFREKSMKKTNYEDYVTLFSDKDSQESAKSRYVKYGYSYGFLFLLYFYIFSRNTSWTQIINFKSWYLTPNIWNLKGGSFWYAFLFETPFALFRVLPLFFFLFLGIYYLIRSLINDDLKFKRK
ncbi:DUF2812 domain-containing protein [Lactococcus lactis]|uniref:DUF2812 domain-containing protein n=1 Tax=Lactococcus lactis TaxID=1358 RepID=UPI0021A4DE35|nr:DUF2812 domain-containing protein [Lactococcus lactis]MCT2921498.1 DUF2812 domain-containing protein [Lactococcus lactis]